MNPEIITEKGVIISIHNNKANVLIQKSDQCGHCPGRGGCLTFDKNEGKRIIEVNNQAGAKVGDQVQLAIEGQKIVKASFIAYIIPSILAIAGAYIGNIYYSNSGAITGFFAGTFIGILFSYLYGKFIDRKKQYESYILKII